MANWQKRPKFWRMRLNFTTFRLHPSNGIWRRSFHRPGFKQKKSNSPKPPKKSSRIGRLWIFKNRIIRGKLQTTQNTKSTSQNLKLPFQLSRVRYRSYPLSSQVQPSGSQAPFQSGPGKNKGIFYWQSYCNSVLSD